MVDRLPCPFCGSTNLLEWIDQGVCRTECNFIDCGATGPSVSCDQGKTEEEYVAEAVELWNARATLHVKFTHSESAFTTINDQVFVPLTPKVQRLA